MIDMLEEILFSKISLPGETVRLLVAVLGSVVCSYYDIFNNKSIPEKVLYLFLAVAFVINAVFFDPILFPFSIAMALFAFGIGFIFYRLGQLGGADVLVVTSIMLLLPIQPSATGLSFNIPFILPILIFSGVLYAAYAVIYFTYKISRIDRLNRSKSSMHNVPGIPGSDITDMPEKPQYLYLLLFLPYMVFSYIYTTSIIFSTAYFLLISVLLCSFIFFMIYRKMINHLIIENVPIENIGPEEVVSLENLDKAIINKYHIPRVLSESDLHRLRRSKLQTLPIYTQLLPYLPFLLVGLIFAVLFGQYLVILP